MKITSDDPVLTAFVLGELDEETRSRVARDSSSDPSLQDEVASIAGMTRLLEDTLGHEQLSLGGERIAEIHRAGQRPDSGVLVMEHRKRARRQTLAAVAGVAALVVAGFVILSNSEVEPTANSAGPEVAGAGGGGLESGGVLPGDSPDLPGVISPAGKGVVGLPLALRRADPSMVERALTENGTLPDRDQFKVADWINLGRGKASDQTGYQQVGDLGVFCELGPCSWNPAAALLMIHLLPADGKTVELEAGLEFDPEKVAEVRLTGGSGEGDELPVASGRLDSPRTYLYEIELVEEEAAFGTLLLKPGKGELHQMILEGPVSDRNEVSPLFTTARILGDFARWGASDGRDRESLVRLSREAKEQLEEVTDESIRYALDMILITEEARGAE